MHVQRFRKEGDRGMSNDLKSGFSEELCANLAEKIHDSVSKYFQDTDEDSVTIVLGGGIMTFNNKDKKNKD